MLCVFPESWSSRAAVRFLSPSCAPFRLSSLPTSVPYLLLPPRTVFAPCPSRPRLSRNPAPVTHTVRKQTSASPGTLRPTVASRIFDTCH